jgi:hypothetical protein
MGIAKFVQDFYAAHEDRYKEHQADVETIRRQWKEASK